MILELRWVDKEAKIEILLRQAGNMYAGPPVITPGQLRQLYKALERLRENPLSKSVEIVVERDRFRITSEEGMDPRPMREKME